MFLRWNILFCYRNCHTKQTITVRVVFGHPANRIILLSADAYATTLNRTRSTDARAFEDVLVPGWLFSKAFNRHTTNERPKKMFKALSELLEVQNSEDLACVGFFVTGLPPIEELPGEARAQALCPIEYPAYIRHGGRQRLFLFVAGTKGDGKGHQENHYLRGPAKECYSCFHQSCCQVGAQNYYPGFREISEGLGPSKDRRYFALAAKRLSEIGTRANRKLAASALGVKCELGPMDALRLSYSYGYVRGIVLDPMHAVLENLAKHCVQDIASGSAMKSEGTLCVVVFMLLFLRDCCAITRCSV